MAHLSSDGQPFSPEDIKRLREALISLSLDCLEVAPVALNAKRLRAGYAQLSAGLERMHPGRYRTQPITSGSLAGFDAARIAPAVGQLLSRHHQLVRRWDSPDQEAVLHHGTSLHAELIRVHPFWGGSRVWCRRGCAGATASTPRNTAPSSARRITAH